VQSPVLFFELLQFHFEPADLLEKLALERCFTAWDTELIRKYIQKQESEDRRLEQMEMPELSTK
jgi:hypothetical protein